MKINEVITESSKPRKLKENAEVAEIGRAIMDMAIKQKDDDLSNQMSSVGDALTRFGTTVGPKSIKDLVKQTGVDQSMIQKMMAAGQKYLEKHGPVRSGTATGDGDDIDDVDADDDREVDIGDDDLDYIDGDQGNEKGLSR